jgi:hypothetical protein
MAVGMVSFGRSEENRKLTYEARGVDRRGRDEQKDCVVVCAELNGKDAILSTREDQEYLLHTEKGDKNSSNDEQGYDTATVPRE